MTAQIGDPQHDTTRQTAPETRYETAAIQVLRRALLADADICETRAGTYANAETGVELAAWTGLLLVGSHGRMVAALLGLLDGPGVPAEIRERGRRLVGQVLDGWPEVLEGANDDLPAAPQPQIPGQGELPAEVPRGFRIGDQVEITAREGDTEATPPGLRLNGRTGYVSQIDGDNEYPIGITVEGWLGPVWCSSGEIRRLDTDANPCPHPTARVVDTRLGPYCEGCGQPAVLPDYADGAGATP